MGKIHSIHLSPCSVLDGPLHTEVETYSLVHILLQQQCHMWPRSCSLCHLRVVATVHTPPLRKHVEKLIKYIYKHGNMHSK